MTSCNVTRVPEDLNDIQEGHAPTVDLTISCDTNIVLSYALAAEDSSIASISSGSTLDFNLLADTPVTRNFTVLGGDLGRTIITFSNANGSLSTFAISEYPLSVIREPSDLDLVFIIILAIMIVFYNIGFGCKVRVAEIKEILKKPIAPIVGAICQFGIMAPLAFGVAKMMGLQSILGLGMLAIGACPGGGGSNVFAYLLDADLELSITMTFISTLLALGMTPLWIWGLGRYFMDGNPHVEIPVQNVFYSLAGVVFPVAGGVLITHLKPKAGEFISRGLKPFSAVIGIVFFSLGVAVYYYALKRVTWQLVIACLVLSGGGYTLGFTAGKLLLRDTKKAVTISLETGFQNLSLALFILTVSLGPPESDLAGAIPIFYTFIGAGYPVIAFIIHKIVQRRKHKPEVSPVVETGDAVPTAGHSKDTTQPDDVSPAAVTRQNTIQGEIGPATTNNVDELDHPWAVKVYDLEPNGRLESPRTEITHL